MLSKVEITERIAKIEGIAVRCLGDACFNYDDIRSNHGQPEPAHYDPFGNGNILKHLIKKYSVHVWQNFHGYWCAECIAEFTAEEDPIVKNPSVQKEYEWAVCLAIVEVHNV